MKKRRIGSKTEERVMNTGVGAIAHPASGQPSTTPGLKYSILNWEKANGGRN
ncbi:hypothetical protein J5X98_00410 [Leptothermofonsia sichuanensis E412]|uniref:hypothetical protein n=1 Tax=Leptothermofonsia sichuanensis TaxID=2917832 RepID=UPI001CA77E66|nr:hypothetical protein [Leptothermofonsia sichuanensis]QZZ21014.1 hypothetical protein J5X98_00410 [Leptothermofonsia sichuanensis E412]